MVGADRQRMWKSFVVDGWSASNRWLDGPVAAALSRARYGLMFSLCVMAMAVVLWEAARPPVVLPVPGLARDAGLRFVVTLFVVTASILAVVRPEFLPDIEESSSAPRLSRALGVILALFPVMALMSWSLSSTLWWLRMLVV